MREETRPRGKTRGGIGARPVAEVRRGMYVTQGVGARGRKRNKRARWEGEGMHAGVVIQGWLK